MLIQRVLVSKIRSIPYVYVNVNELAESFGLDLPVLKLTETLYSGMCEHGLEDLDHSGLYLEIADRGNSQQITG